jgi:TatD DNase family protein
MLVMVPEICSIMTLIFRFPVILMSVFLSPELPLPSLSPRHPVSASPLLPTLDAHAHLHPSRRPEELENSGAVLSMTLSLDQAAAGGERADAWVAWGVGCHPRFPAHQQAFDPARFRVLVEQTAIAGEIGLDGGSRVPMEMQLRTFRACLKVIAALPRMVSIHAYEATSLVLDELQVCPVCAPVLHWWTGTAAETRRAVELGCYFSIHSQVARQSKFRCHVPLERVLVESDHGQNDPPPATRPRIEWVEYLVAQQYKIDVADLRRVVWANFARIIEETGTESLLPQGFRQILLFSSQA